MASTRVVYRCFSVANYHRYGNKLDNDRNDSSNTDGSDTTRPYLLDGCRDHSGLRFIPKLLVVATTPSHVEGLRC